MPSGMTMQIIMLVGLIALMYFLLIRPQKKRDKQVNDMRNSVKTGDEVVTIGGIYGKVVKVRDDRLTIMVGTDKTKIEVTRWAISKIENASTQKGGRPEKSEKSEEKEEAETKRKPKPKKMLKKAETEEAPVEEVKETVEEAPAEVTAENESAAVEADAAEKAPEAMEEASEAPVAEEAAAVEESAEK